MVPRVFIASSTEGQPAVVALQRLLRQDLPGGVEPVPWTHSFELSSTTIESLEKASTEVDFAIFVLTADDDVTVRTQAAKAPRDNVTFELGFFTGRLGRSRCYLVEERAKEALLRIPSDLLGITRAGFSRPSQGSWDEALAAASSHMAKGIEDQGCLTRFGPDFLSRHSLVRAFCDRLVGFWWERLGLREEGPWVSFFRIEFDPANNSVRLLAGRAYDSQGRHGSNWESKVARVSLEEEMIDYHWSGWVIDESSQQRHGFGSISFDQLSEPNSPFARARGRFWDVHEARPEKTEMKPVEMKRASPRDVQTMTTESANARAELVRRILADW